MQNLPIVKNTQRNAAMNREIYFYSLRINMFYR